ncbi:unnamed protein product [Calypogeia fissa]
MAAVSTAAAGLVVAATSVTSSNLRHRAQHRKACQIPSSISPFQSLRASTTTTPMASSSGRTSNQQQHEELAGTTPSTSTSTSSTRGLCDTVLGVLGGGQLGRMLCQAASPMGIKVAVLDPLPDCPAGGIAYEHTVGSFRDTNAVRSFAEGCGVLTVEIEHVDVETLEALASEGADVEPKPFTIRTIQDKYLQKVHFRNNGVALPDFMKIDNAEGAQRAGRAFGYPLMLKSRLLAYDGRGNAVVRSEDDFLRAVSLLGGYERGLYAEKWAPFVKELAIMVARGRDGTVRSFPVVETTHKDNICSTVEAPANVSSDVAKKAMTIAEKAIKSLEGAGVFGVELFLLADGQVLLNEVAPRPHNSGHYTIEACFVSQYEQHLRAVLGLPLGDPSMKVPAALMYNLLGEDEGEAGFAMMNQILVRAATVPGASIHWYEKPEIRWQRKMGHITLVGQSASELKARLGAIVDSDCPNGTVHALLKRDSELSTDDKQPVVSPVGIIMGSDSDLPVMKDAAQILDLFGIAYELTIVSAHRTPERMVTYAQNAHKRGVKVIIAGAGGAAHLPGMVAGLTPLPVIGVPVKGSSTDGLDSLLSIVQMPRGVPVAAVAIQNATNAGLLAVRILGTADPQHIERMMKYQDELRDTVLNKVEKLERVGWQEYLK